MRVVLSVCIFTFGALFTSGLLAGQTAKSVTEDVTAAVRGRMDAFNRRDIPAFEAYFATEYVGLDEDAAVSVVPPDYRTFPREYSQVHDLRDFVVRIHGDTAIVVYRTTEDEPFDGLVLTTEERRNETWQLQRGHWRLLMAQRAGIPVQKRAATPLDARLLPNYAGTYQLRANENMFVTVDAAHLFLTFNLNESP